MNHKRGTLEYFQELFELAPAAYLVTDPHLAITDANGAAAKLLGKPHDQLLGKPLVMFIEPGEREVFREMVIESLIAKKQLVQPLSLQPVRGQDVDVLYSAGVVHDAQDNLTAIHWLFIEGFEGGQGDLL
jgi:PAS domain S-box-containing protein